MEAMSQTATVAVASGGEFGPLGDSLCLPEVRELREFKFIRKLTVPMEEPRRRDIEIRAIAEEEEENGCKVVQVSIYSAETEFQIPHFSGRIFLQKPQPKEDAVVPSITIPSKDSRNAVNLYGKRDFYGGVLFQQGRFQRMDHVVGLSSSSLEYITTSNGCDDSVMSCRWMLGDPFIRDTMLQSIQPCVPNKECLPVAIQRIRLSQATRVAGERRVVGVVLEDEVVPKSISGASYSMSPSGQVLELIEGYEGRVMTRHPITLQRLIAGPGDEDCKVLQELADKISEQNSSGALKKRLSIAWKESMKHLKVEERHGIQESMIKAAALEFIDNDKKSSFTGSIQFPKNSAPVLQDSVAKDVGVSVSNSGDYCVVVVGRGSQGCDLQAILLEQDREQGWVDLLGEKHEKLLQRLTSARDYTDRAGTRIWAALEAAFKAFSQNLPGLSISDINLELENSDDTLVVLRASHAKSGKRCNVFTSEVQLARGPRRIFALTDSVTATAPISSEILPRHEPSQQATGTLPKHQNLLRASTKPSPEDVVATFDWLHSPLKQEIAKYKDGRLGVVMRFYTSFQHTKTVLGRVPLTSLVDWVGAARGVALEGVLLVDPAASQHLLGGGNPLVVTKMTSVDMYGELNAFDLVEVQTVITEATAVGGRLSFYIYKVDKETLKQDFLAASAVMEYAWCSFDSKGLPKLSQQPEWSERFFDNLSNVDTEVHAAETPATASPLYLLHQEVSADLEDQRSKGHGTSSRALQPFLVGEKQIETSTEDSNLVGNIYFAKFFAWAASALDSLLVRLNPDYLRCRGAKGELLVISVRVDYGLEIWPSEVIDVKISPKVIGTKGISWHVEYFHSDPVTQQRAPVATASMTTAWRPAKSADETLPSWITNGCNA